MTWIDYKTGNVTRDNIQIFYSQIGGSLQTERQNAIEKRKKNTKKDSTFYQKLSRQLPPHMTNRFRPVPRIPSFPLTLLGVLAFILT